MRSGRWFRLNFNEFGLRPDQDPAAGFMDFFTTDVGLVNLNYSSTPAPRNFPILCAERDRVRQHDRGLAVPDDLGRRARRCWPSRWCKGTTWTSTGGAANDVAAANRYLGHERVKVPAFPARRRRGQGRSR